MVYLFSESFLFWCHSTLLCFVPLYFTVYHLALINDNFLWTGGHLELLTVPSASDSVIPSCFQRFMNLNSMVISPLSPQASFFFLLFIQMCFQHCSSGTVHFSVQAFQFEHASHSFSVFFTQGKKVPLGQFYSTTVRVPLHVFLSLQYFLIYSFSKMCSISVSAIYKC